MFSLALPRGGLYADVNGDLLIDHLSVVERRPAQVRGPSVVRSFGRSVVRSFSLYLSTLFTRTHSLPRSLLRPSGCSGCCNVTLTGR